MTGLSASRTCWTTCKSVTVAVVTCKRVHLYAHSSHTKRVGSAGKDAAPEVQKEIIAKAFGDNAVRSVPTMGKRDFDDDAQRIGANVVKTSQMSGGFREMAKVHLPTAKDAVQQQAVSVATGIAALRFTVTDVTEREDPRLAWIEKRGGSSRVERCLSFAVWFCQKLVDSTGESMVPVTGALALGNQPTLLNLMTFSTFLAHWSNDNRLTLALECECFWERPIGAEALAILIHEAAHARNLHHGKKFTEEVERLGGVAAELMLHHGHDVRKLWPDLPGIEPNLVADCTSHRQQPSLFGRLFGASSPTP